MRAASRRGALLCALVIGLLPSAHAVDGGLTGGPLIRTVGESYLQAGAGTDFSSPIEVDVLVATLAISNTGGGNWNVKVAREGNESLWPAGVSIALKRSGGSGESGITDGTSYRTLTGDLQTFFSGTGDYGSIQILLRLEGVSVHTPPGQYTVAIRYTVEAS